MPQSLSPKGETLTLSFPEKEEGIPNDFLGVFIDDIYRIRKIKSPVKNVIDIGSNVGFVSCAARLNFPEAVIHAYEPNSTLAPFLHTNRQTFPFEVFLVAVGGEAGSIKLDLRGDSNQTRVDSSAESGDTVKLPLG